MGLCASNDIRNSGTGVRTSSTSSKQMDEEELKQTVNRFFDQYDKNRSGFLSRDEAMVMVKRLNKQMAKSRNSKKDDQLLDDLFKIADIDGDGRISKNQFLIYFKNQ